jgi:hypothetical protein
MAPLSSIRLLYAAIALALYVLLAESTDILTVKPNYRWKSKGCKPFDIEEVYGAILKSLAVSTSHRELYMHLRSTWMQHLRWAGSSVEVRCTSYHELPEMVVKQSKEVAYDTEYNQTYRALYVSVPHNVHGEASAFHNHIDTFLQENPCWILIHEPPYIDVEDPELLLRNQSSWYSSAVIMLHLPSYPYAKTCQFFEYVKRRNFPEVCPDQNDLFLYYPTNNGFGGEGNKIVRVIQYLLWNDTESVLAHFATKLKYVSRNKALGMKREWLWSNEDHCPPAVYENETFSCNFMPITKCGVGDRVSKGVCKRTCACEYV